MSETTRYQVGAATCTLLADGQFNYPAAWFFADVEPALLQQKLQAWIRQLFHCRPAFRDDRACPSVHWPFQVSAKGVLQDGKQFQLQVATGGPAGDPKHVKIAFWQIVPAN